MPGIFSGKQRLFILVLVIVTASSVIAIVIYNITLSSQSYAEAKTIISRVLVTKTLTSIQDPALGHESHQAAIFLPPVAADIVYSGTLTWVSSDPVELFTYHHYNGPVENSPPLYTEPSNGMTYASPLFFTPPNYSSQGSIVLAGNAIGFHSLEGTEFTVTATFDGWTKTVTLPKSNNNNETGATPSQNFIIAPTQVDPQDLQYVVLSESQIQEALNNDLKGWQLEDNRLYKSFQFKNFVEAFQFMYKVGLEAERMNHHPDWTNNYGTVSVYLGTWTLGKEISGHDIKLAGIIDREAAVLGATSETDDTVLSG